MYARILRGVLLCTVVLWQVPVWAGLDIQKWSTADGAKVLFVANHDLPIVDVNIDFPAGSAYDTPDQSGLAHLTNHLLTLGAAGLDENAMALAQADIGASIGERFGQEEAGLSLRTLSSEPERQKAMTLLAQSLQQPRFDDAVLMRERTRMVAAIKEAEALPGTVAGKAFLRALYRQHPYALPENGEPASLARLTRADVQRFYRDHYQARYAVIAIIGDLTRPQAEALALQLTQNLPAPEGAALPPIPPVPPLPGADVEHISHPSSQSHVLIGAPGMTRTDPDYYPLLVGNYVLGGGGFDSRLTQVVRDKNGLAYSVYSYFSPMRQQGPFVVGLQTKNASAAEAVSLVRGVLDRFIAEGPTAAELKQAKANIAGGFPLRLDSNRKIIEYLSVIGDFDLPLDWLDAYPKKVEAVTLEQIRDAFRRRLDPHKLVEVVVGGAPQNVTPGKDARVASSAQ